ncbi:hypothetical protein [Bacillus toyonensis]|uniref:hypothetical protein n=1 Tax=Bacillus toyonensis TaxID=155322 RepID=UPI000BF36BBF|nr:hypothetical protein [Bacillus toyonensis]PGF05313.1 hypothetical protein COM61_02565 [Bacillus toyonensis]
MSELSLRLIPSHTLLCLKAYHKQLGHQGTIYYISNVATEVDTYEVKYMITQVVINGVISYVLDESKLLELFSVQHQTLKEYREGTTKLPF